MGGYPYNKVRRNQLIVSSFCYGRRALVCKLFLICGLCFETAFAVLNVRDDLNKSAEG